MKLKYLTFLLLFAVLVSCRHEKKELYADGRIKSVQQLKGKKNDGLGTWYYENGKKQLEVNYKNGLSDGITTRWYYNGQKESVETYLNGKKNGRSITYTASGVPVEDRTYLNDTLNGPYKLYHESGAIKAEGYYYMGLFDSLWVWTNEFGFRVGDAMFKKGEGIQKAYHMNGSLWKEVPYKNNKRNGTETEYSTYGKSIKLIFWENDIQVKVKETGK